MSPSFFSIPDLCLRWSCGRTKAYEAVRDMEQGGYLDRIFIGKDQRIALRSVETWERLHAQAPGEDPTRKVVELREQNVTPKRAPRLPAADVDIASLWKERKNKRREARPS